MRERLVVLGVSAVVALVAVPRGTPPVHRAQDVCANVVVSGLVNHGTGWVCVPTPLETNPLHFGHGQAGVRVDVYLTYP